LWGESKWQCKKLSKVKSTSVSLQSIAVALFVLLVTKSLNCLCDSIALFLRGIPTAVYAWQLHAMLLIVCMESADISEEQNANPSSQISLVPEQTIYYVDCNIQHCLPWLNCCWQYGRYMMCIN